MNIAYVSTYDVKDIRQFSGLGYYIAQALEMQSIPLEYICPLEERCSLLFKGKVYFYKQLLHQRYFRDREPFILKEYAKQVSHKLSQINSDIVFSPGTIPISYLECDRPIAFWTDSNFASMINFYPKFSNMCEETIKNGNAMEKAALQKSSLAIYSSEWAAKTAIENYHVEQSKVKVVPFGANIDCDRNVNDVKNLIESRSANLCKLLFLGVDWFRKGGNIALEVTKELNKSGLKTELTIIGCEPITNELPNFIKPLGFISKLIQSGKKQIEKIISESHFLILPTIADCSPHALAEANSFGVPCISTNVGGIPTIIKDDINGKLFDKDSEITEYCQYISHIFANYPEYKNLAFSAFNEYQLNLNWSAAGQTVKRLLENIQ